MCHSQGLCSIVMDDCCKAHSELPPGMAGDPDGLRNIAAAFRERRAEAGRDFVQPRCYTPSACTRCE